jgi:8-oxo-dGTP pyrophosphatase MutT (NUDIX family)
VSVIRQLSSREVYRNSWLRLREDEVLFPNGSTGSFAIVEKPDFVLVVPYDNGGFWLVEQFRYSVGSREWEFPQGTWPAGRSGTVLELAAAELGEETGLRASSFTHLGRLFAAYGYCGQAFDIYLAEGLSEGEPDREDTESDMVHRWFPEADLRAMVRSGEFRDAHSVAALTLFDACRA